MTDTNVDTLALAVARRFTLDTQPQRRAGLQVAIIEAIQAALASQPTPGGGELVRLMREVIPALRATGVNVTLADDVERAIAALPHPQPEKACETCGRTVLVENQSCAGWIAPCGNRLTRIEQCGTAGDVCRSNEATPPPPSDAAQGEACHCATCTGMTPAVRFDTSPAEREGAVREHLISLGWTPPATSEDRAQRLAEWLAVPGNARVMLGGNRPATAAMYLDHARSILAAADSAERCLACDNSGDVHRADGEWLGECTVCKPAASVVPIPTLDTEAAAYAADMGDRWDTMGEDAREAARQVIRDEHAARDQLGRA